MDFFGRNRLTVTANRSSEILGAWMLKRPRIQA
jgi:hypothetical protein